MELIKEFNDWLIENNFSIKSGSFDKKLIEEINEVHKFKAGGRNELDKYMKILITKYELMKNEEKVITYKEIVSEFKKQKKSIKNKKNKKELKVEKEDIKKERCIIVDEKLNTKNLVLIERVENVIKEMVVGLLGPPQEKEWKIVIAKNIYSLKIEKNFNIESDEKINLEIYGKKLIKRDIKLITDYLTKKRKIKEKKVVIDKKEKVEEKVEEEVEEKVEEEVKEKVEEEVKEKVEEEDKKKLYKELFGDIEDIQEIEDEIEDKIYKESEEIDNLIVDLEDIKFDN